LKVVVEEAKAHTREHASVNMDETSWHEKGKFAWLWVGGEQLRW
jgi:hypothetical protein